MALFNKDRKPSGNYQRDDSFAALQKTIIIVFFILVALTAVYVIMSLITGNAL